VASIPKQLDSAPKMPNSTLLDSGYCGNTRPWGNTVISHQRPTFKDCLRKLMNKLKMWTEDSDTP